MALHYLLKAWLARVAQQTVQEAVVAAARGKAEPSSGAEGDDTTCHAAALFALSVESGCFEDLLGANSTVTKGDGFTVRRGKLARRSLLVVLTGPGCQAAAHATEAIITAHRPRLVISAGFGGRLAAHLKRNDIVVGTSVKRVDGPEIPMAGPSASSTLAAAGSESARVFAGRILTVDRVIRLPAEKRTLAEAQAAMVVDMETHAVAEVCQRRATPCLAVRAIIDAADDELPRDVERLLAQKTAAARWGAALGSLVNRPAVARDLYALKANSLSAADRLAKFLASYGLT